MDINKDKLMFPLVGNSIVDSPIFMGVFDGMGGEEHGEIASLLAAKEAACIKFTGNPLNDLLKYCKKANDRICDYTKENSLSSMGTTAALLAFTDKEIILCNIGDSKIFYFANNRLEQISVDHVGVSAYGTKPPISQNLGIPSSEMIIVPYVARGRYNNGDIYLICSDGLTDMVSSKEISDTLCNEDFHKTAKVLLDKALSNGGKDNITIILCRVERIKETLSTLLFKTQKHRGQQI